MNMTKIQIVNEHQHNHQNQHLNLGVSAITDVIHNGLTVLEILATNDFSNTVDFASKTQDLFPVGLEFLFECVHWCVGFLKVVPWIEEEETRDLSLISFLGEEESK